MGGASVPWEAFRVGQVPGGLGTGLVGREWALEGNGGPWSDLEGGFEGAEPGGGYSTVTDLARLRGWSTSQPRRRAMW
jgi:hypothetical protein